MNLAVAATTFAVVLPAELPDKTFIAGVVLSARHRPFAVWVGTAAGLVLQAGIGVLAGRLFALLPHRAVEGVVTGLFLLGGLYLLFLPERKVKLDADELAEQEDKRVGPPPESFPKVALTAFGVVALAEFGDLTQVVVTNFAARYKDPLSVFVGAAVAFLLVSGAGVATGRTLVRYVPLALVRKLSGLVLVGFGVWNLVEVLR